MNTLDACKQYIESKGCTLWRDWDVSTPDGLDRAAAALEADVDGVLQVKVASQVVAPQPKGFQHWPAELRQDVEPWLLAKQNAEAAILNAEKVARALEGRQVVKVTTPDPLPYA